MNIISTLFGGAVDPNSRWVNTWQDSQFHEWGSNPDGSFSPQCRLTYTAPADGQILLMAEVKQRLGQNDGTFEFYNRAYTKVRIVQIAPTYINNFTIHQEGTLELNPAPAEQIIRFLDAPMTKLAVVPVQAGVTYTFSVEHLCGDNHLGEVDYGCPFILLA